MTRILCLFLLTVLNLTAFEVRAQQSDSNPKANKSQVQNQYPNPSPNPNPSPGQNPNQIQNQTQIQNKGPNQGTPTQTQPGAPESQPGAAGTQPGATGSPANLPDTGGLDPNPGAAKKQTLGTNPVSQLLAPEISERHPDWETIEIDGQDVFTIRTNLGPYSIKSRAENIRKILARLAREPNYLDLINSIHAVNDRQVAHIKMGDEAICFITDKDSLLNGDSSRMVTAQKYAERLKLALLKDQSDRRPGHLLVASGLTTLATLAFLASLAMLNWLFPKLYSLARSGQLLKPLRIQKAELISLETMVDLYLGVMRLVRAAAVIFLLSLYIPAVLSFFPDTRGLANEIVGYMIQPVREIAIPALLAYLPNILVIAFVALATYYSICFIHFVFREIERGNITISGFDREWADPTYKIVRFLVITFSFVMVFPYLPGSGSPAFQQVSIFLGVLFSLGSTGAISHLVAGVFLTYTGAFKLGDRVKIADAVGDVVEKTLLATRIRTIKHEYITIPNGLVLSSHIVNYSASSGKPGLVLHTTVTIGYDAPWRAVHQALLSAAKSTEGLSETPAPFVLQTSLDDNYVSYELNAYTNQPETMAVTYSHLHQNIQDKFNEAGIEIMSPHYTSLRDGNRTTIPESYWSKDYEIRRFGVKMQ